MITKLFNNLKTVDEQYGICGHNVVFKSLSTHKEKDVAIVAVEECQGSVYCTSLYIHCPDIDFVEHVCAGKRSLKEDLSLHTNYDMILPVKFNDEAYLCFHRFVKPEELVMLGRMAQKIASSCSDVMKAVLKAYMEIMRDKLKYKRSRVFSNLCEEFLQHGTCDAERAISEYIFFEKIQQQKQVSLIDEYSKVMFCSEKDIMFKTF